MTPAQRRALDRQSEKMRANDEKRVTIILNAKTRARLDWLAKSYGSRQRVIEALVNGD